LPFRQRRREGEPKRILTIVDQRRAVAQKKTMLAADGAPDQRMIERIEFLDAARRFDHFRSREAQAALLRHHDARATSCRNAHAAETAKLSPARRHDAFSANAWCAEGVSPFRYRASLGIGLLAPSAAILALPPVPRV